MVSLGKLRADFPELASWIISNASSNEYRPASARRFVYPWRFGFDHPPWSLDHISQFIVLPLRFHRRTWACQRAWMVTSRKIFLRGPTVDTKADGMAVCYGMCWRVVLQSLRHSKRCNHRILPDQPIIRQSDCICLSTKPDSGTHS